MFLKRIVKANKLVIGEGEGGGRERRGRWVRGWRKGGRKRRRKEMGVDKCRE